MLLKAEYEHALVFVEEPSSEIGRLTDACKEHRKKLQICEEKDKKFNEDITTLRIQLVKSKIIEEVNCNK